MLLVEDHRGYAAALKRVLERGDWEVQVAETAALALAAARLRRFDAMLVDFRLPDQTGLEFVRAARQDGLRMPALLLTAYPDTAIAAAAAHMGVRYFYKGAVTTDQIAFETHEAIARFARRETQTAVITSAIDDLIRALDSDRQLPTSLASVLSLLSGDDISIVTFACGADVVRITVDDRRGFAERVRAMRWRLGRIRQDVAATADLDLDRLAAGVESAGAQWRSLDADQIGAGHLLTGVEPELARRLAWSWRRFCLYVVVRKALPAVVHSSEHVRQIAFQLKYDFATAFDRDFREVLGLSPTRLRRLVKVQP